MPLPAVQAAAPPPESWPFRGCDGGPGALEPGGA